MAAEELRVDIVGEIPEGAQSSTVRARFAPDDDEDVQGQSFRGAYVAPTEDDAEGQSIRGSWLKPMEAEDAEGQGGRFGRLSPQEGEEEDARGNVLRSHVLEIRRDENGKLVGRYVRAPKTTKEKGKAPRLSR